LFGQKIKSGHCMCAAACCSLLDWTGLALGSFLPRAHSWLHHQTLPTVNCCGTEHRECPELHQPRESLSTNSTISRFLVSLLAQHPFVSSASPQVQSVLVLVHPPPQHRRPLCALCDGPPEQRQSVQSLQSHSFEQCTSCC
jgi:hypothetical protein